MDPQEKQDARRSEVGEAIWTTSRRDEGTISAMGADIIAAHLDDQGMITDPCTCGPWHPNMDGPSEECPRHGRPYEYWIEGCNVMSSRLSKILELHVKEYRTTADEVWDRNPYCAECQDGFPCETVKILDGRD